MAGKEESGIRAGRLASPVRAGAKNTLGSRQARCARRLRLARARAIRRANRAGADTRPRPPAIARELGSRCREGRVRERRNETGWRNDMPECENGVRKVRRVRRGGARSAGDAPRIGVRGRLAERAPSRPCISAIRCCGYSRGHTALRPPSSPRLEATTVRFRICGQGAWLGFNWDLDIPFESKLGLEPKPCAIRIRYSEV